MRLKRSKNVIFADEVASITRSKNGIMKMKFKKKILTYDVYIKDFFY
jgi:hypothetical protein